MPESLTPEQQAEWDAWLDERPASVREVAERLPPWHTYRLTTTDQLCSIDHYDEHEDGQVTLSIVAWREWMPLPRGVFGINPDDLEVVTTDNA